MALGEMIKQLREFRGITRKGCISDITKLLPSGWPGVLADFGEDAAVIERGGEALLLAADGIVDELLSADPEWAGYCSVLVNVNDIASMGGSPLAMVNVISAHDMGVARMVAEGMARAVEKFAVPMVGGHVHPDAPCDALDVAILGVARKGSVLYSHTARLGDSVVIAMDLDGTVRPEFRYAWDTTTHKGPKAVRGMVSIMGDVASLGSVRACKDISNPGTLGTLGMLLESSGKGATVDLSNVPRPDRVELVHWLQMYQGFGFVMSVEPSGVQKVLDTLGSVGLTGAECGTITGDGKLTLRYEGESATLFDLNIDGITGIKG